MNCFTVCATGRQVDRKANRQRPGGNEHALQWDERKPWAIPQTVFRVSRGHWWLPPTVPPIHQTMWDQETSWGNCKLKPATVCLRNGHVVDPKQRIYCGQAVQQYGQGQAEFRHERRTSREQLVCAITVPWMGWGWWWWSLWAVSLGWSEERIHLGPHPRVAATSDSHSEKHIIWCVDQDTVQCSQC